MNQNATANSLPRLFLSKLLLHLFTTLRFQIVDQGITGSILTASPGTAEKTFTRKSDKLVMSELKTMINSYPCIHRPQYAYKKYRYVKKDSLKEKMLPTVLDDFYLNILHWGLIQNAQRLAIACIGEVLVLDSDLNIITTFGTRRETSNRHESLSNVIAQTLGAIVSGPVNAGTPPPESMAPVPDEILTPQLRRSATPRHDQSMRFIRRDSSMNPLSGDRIEYTAVRWDPLGRYLAFGTRTGDIELWDPVAQRLVTTLGAHCQRVGVLEWVPGEENQNLLTSGSRDKTLMIHDLRSASPAIEVDKHKQEVCGLAWRPANQRDPAIRKSLSSKDVSDNQQFAVNGENYWEIMEAERIQCERTPQVNLEQTKTDVFHSLYNALGQRTYPCGAGTRNSVPTLASGGNDNKIYLWELGQTNPITKFAEHTAAVKALAWAPVQRGVLASGGGTNDRTIRLWDTEHKLELCSCETEAQVCNLFWSPLSLELMSSHGYTLNQVNLWDLKTREDNKIRLRKAETLTGHTSRVLFMSASPDGQHVATVSGDGSLKVWDAFSS